MNDTWNVVAFFFFFAPCIISATLLTRNLNYKYILYILHCNIILINVYIETYV
jgi:hypothetical protein